MENEECLNVNTRATQHLFDAAVHRAEVAEDIHTVARLNAITAPHAADWKAAVPSNKEISLSHCSSIQPGPGSSGSTIRLSRMQREK